MRPWPTWKGITLGDLLEGIVPHAFEGQAPFREETLAKIRDLRAVFGLGWTRPRATG